jgi:hypothetical protein
MDEEERFRKLLAATVNLGACSGEIVTAQQHKIGVHSA